MRILVTGANGVTGQAVIRHLVARGGEVHGLVSQSGSAPTIEKLGAAAVVGDLRDEKDLRRAMSAVERVYHICPAWVADEADIGAAMIAAARAAGIALFGYHSALAPHLEEVPSHWAKMQVQMALMHGGVPFSVMQPAAYMQSATGSLNVGGDLVLPVDIDAALSWVDVEDVGAAVANLMTRPAQRGGTYELCGTAAPMSLRDLAADFSAAFGRRIAARTCSLEDYARQLPLNAGSGAPLARLEAYFGFIDKYGLRAGNPNVLAMLLGRPPTSVREFAERRARAA